MPEAVVLVTGGTRGIGAGIARSFLEAGATVIVCARNPPANALPAADGREAIFVSCDVRQPDSVQALFAKIRDECGGLDVLVNNAGGSPPANLAESSPKLIEKIIALNLTAPLLCAQAANRQMQSQPQGGCVINICSVSAVRPSPGTAAYGAAKAGLLSATASLALEWGPKVRINAIVVGLVATEDSAEHYGGRAGMERIAAMLPLGRMAEPSDIASTCLYLASPLASYVSGAHIHVHGGGEWPVFLHLAKESGSENTP